MNESLQLLFSALTFLGVGGIVGGYITHLLDKKKELQFKQLEQKQGRYRSCLLYMDVFFEPKNIKYLSSRQADIHGERDVLEYLKAEYHEMILYASKDVVLSVKAFIEAPSRLTFLRTVLSMRNDLWPNNSSLTIGEITIADSQIIGSAAE